MDCSGSSGREARKGRMILALGLGLLFLFPASPGALARNQESREASAESARREKELAKECRLVRRRLKKLDLAQGGRRSAYARSAFPGDLRQALEKDELLPFLLTLDRVVAETALGEALEEAGKEASHIEPRDDYRLALCAYAIQTLELRSLVPAMICFLEGHHFGWFHHGDHLLLHALIRLTDQPGADLKHFYYLPDEKEKAVQRAREWLKRKGVSAPPPSPKEPGWEVSPP